MGGALSIKSEIRKCVTEVDVINSITETINKKRKKRKKLCQDKNGTDNKCPDSSQLSVSWDLARA